MKSMFVIFCFASIRNFFTISNCIQLKFYDENEIVFKVQLQFGITLNIFN